ncbi:MAG: hypothetical protein P4L90_27180 [Rhodopila sp.]|nr:hypothetical protein [Rhodopila sp.]
MIAYGFTSAGARRSGKTGALKLSIILPDNVPKLRKGARAGDAEAIRIRAFIRESDPKICAACTRPLRGLGYAFALAMPLPGDPTPALGLVICDQCGTSPEVVQAKAISAFGKIPGARVAMLHKGGRA